MKQDEKNSKTEIFCCHSNMLGLRFVTSQFLLKGHKTLNFLFAFFPRFPTLWKLIALEWKQISTNIKKLSSWSFILVNKKLIKNFDKSNFASQCHFCSTYNQCILDMDLLLSSRHTSVFKIQVIDHEFHFPINLCICETYLPSLHFLCTLNRFGVLL